MRYKMQILRIYNRNAETRNILLTDRIKEFDIRQYRFSTTVEIKYADNTKETIECEGAKIIGD